MARPATAAASGATPSMAAALWYSSTANADPKGTGVLVGELRSISGPTMTQEAIDVTHLNSPGDHREFIGGVFDGGEVTFSINFNDANAGQVKATGFWSSMLSSPAAGGTVPTWEVEVYDRGGTTNSNWFFAGILTGCGMGELNPTSPVTFDCSIKVSGAVTFTKSVTP